MHHKHGPRTREERIGKRSVRIPLSSDNAEVQLAAAALLGGVVIIDHALHAALRVAARALQVLVRVGEFIVD